MQSKRNPLVNVNCLSYIKQQLVACPQTFFFLATIARKQTRSVNFLLSPPAPNPNLPLQ